VSKSEYLETQYRLLRCEATEGLRFSVRSFVEASLRRQELWDDDNTWVYPNVRCLLTIHIHRTTLTHPRYEFVGT
jgi:hypothetical protein